VERDGPEAHRHGGRHRQVGETEHHGLGVELAQVTTDPRRRGDGQRARDDHRARLADPDRRASARATRHERQRDAEQPAGRRDEHRGPRIDEPDGQAGRGQHRERHAVGIAARPRREPRDRQPERHQRGEHQEALLVVGRREAAAVEGRDLARLDGQREHDAGRESGETHDRAQARSRSKGERQRRRHACDDDEGEGRHRGRTAEGSPA
jgi:hypothetical protein